MFDIDDSPSYLWPVEVSTPIDGGQHRKDKFDALFKRVSQTRIEEFVSSAMSDRDIAREVVDGWKGVRRGGQELPFSADALENLLSRPGVATGISLAFFESVSGGRRKN